MTFILDSGFWIGARGKEQGVEVFRHNQARRWELYTFQPGEQPELAMLATGVQQLGRQPALFRQ